MYMRVCDPFVVHNIAMKVFFADQSVNQYNLYRTYLQRSAIYSVIIFLPFATINIQLIGRRFLVFVTCVDNMYAFSWPPPQLLSLSNNTNYLQVGAFQGLFLTSS